MTAIDGTAPVRKGEELDVARLSAYLSTRLPDYNCDAVTVEQFPGGHSNLTYLLRLGERQLVLRRPPFGSRVATAHDMSREYAVLSRLSPVYAKAPAAVLFCDDPAIIGGPFYLMERISGLILRQRLPADFDLTPAIAEGLSQALVDTLAELHNVDIEATGLASIGRPAGYVQRQVEGWTKRYAAAQTDDIRAVDEIAAWLADNLPSSKDSALIHNDFKLDNVVLAEDDPTRIIGILDWEMATIGDPLMDLGTTLCYWVEAGDPPPMHMLPFGPTRRSGMLSRKQLVARYQEKSRRDIHNPVFYYAFGLFKTAVVAQQIYFRFKQGHTSDPRFEQMLMGVRVLSNAAAAAVARGSL